MDLENVRFIPLPGTLLDNSSGLEAELIVEKKESSIPLELLPEKLLAAIRKLEEDQKSYFYFWRKLFSNEVGQAASRLSALRECETCLLDRVDNPSQQQRKKTLL
jgi:hypothetical protein